MIDAGIPRTRDAFLRWATNRLAAAGLDEPGREAWRVLSPGTGAAPSFLMRPTEEIPPAERKDLVRRVDRRVDREPLAYIRGRSEFMSLEFCVDRRVLIPRPETEILVEAVLERAGDIPAGAAVDLGTGSGIIAISLALQLRDRPFYATDISTDVLALAGRNVYRYGLQDRVHLRMGDLTRALPPGTPVAILVANPPYIPSDELNGLQPEVSRWEPSAALDGGRDGLAIVRRILAEANPLLIPGALMALELGAEQAPAVAEAFWAAGFVAVTTIPDLAGIPRVVLGRRPGEVEA